MKMIKIYKLIYKGDIVYVGQTKQKYLSNRKAIGYGDTVPFFKECSIELIEETTDVSRERYWIEKLRSDGHNLLNKLKGDGLDRKEWYQNNKDKNRDKNKEYQKEWYQKSKEKIKEKNKEWYQNNKEKRKQYLKEYRLKNKEKVYE